MVGASDGKYVIPLAAAGYQVTAIEPDATAVHGGEVELPGHVHGTMLGLHRRLAGEGVADRVTVVEDDLLAAGGLPPHDAVWTSCSWHYSINHTRPLGHFVDAMRALCAPGGLLGTEFMMPVQARHHDIEHYLEEGAIRHYLRDWPLLWESYTPTFIEDPHVQQLRPHPHRMGFAVARRPA